MDELRKGVTSVNLLDKDARVMDRLCALGEEGMASGVDEAFDIDAFIGETKLMGKPGGRHLP